MRVTTWENVDVEVTVDVKIADVLCEFSNEIDEAIAVGEDRLKSVMLPAIDTATRLLAQIPDETLPKLTAEHRTEIIKRLRTELDRYELANVGHSAQEHHG